MKNDLQDIKSDEQSLLNTQYSGINWVGMSKIQSFIEDDGRHIPVELDLYVNLLPGHRGIHMSRLYQMQMDFILGRKISSQALKGFLLNSIISQDGISNQARLKIVYSHLRMTKSLKSGSDGFRNYPLAIQAEAHKDGSFKMRLQFILTYSSTCPQSSKLAKEYFKNQQLTGSDLEAWYRSDQIFPATPHAQRSHMTVEVVLNADSDLNISQWIEQIEKCLQTPVQTAVKKADEMEFARLNGENPLFCEDAVRKVAQLLDSNLSFTGYQISADHLESLHPHNASSQISKNF